MMHNDAVRREESQGRGHDNTSQMQHPDVQGKIRTGWECIRSLLAGLTDEWLKKKNKKHLFSIAIHL